MNRHIFTSRIDWNDLTLEIAWEPAWLSRAVLGDAPVGHLQVTSIAPARAPLPVSETGYRSLFIDPARVIAEGGPLNFVRAWLDHEAATPSWRAQVDAARQGVLL